jgi:hypothetical protein
MITKSGTRGQHAIVDVNAFDSKVRPTLQILRRPAHDARYKVTVRTEPSAPLSFYRDSANKVQIVYALGWPTSLSLRLLQPTVLVLRIRAKHRRQTSTSASSATRILTAWLDRRAR